MKITQYSIRTAVVWIILLGFLTFSQPTNVPVVLLIVPFVLLFIAFYSLWDLISLLYSHYILKKTYHSSRRLGITICASSVILLILQSLGQLSLRDVVTVLAIVIIGSLYIGRNMKGEREP